MSEDEGLQISTFDQFSQKKWTNLPEYCENPAEGHLSVWQDKAKSYCNLVNVNFWPSANVQGKIKAKHLQQPVMNC